MPIVHHCCDSGTKVNGLAHVLCRLVVRSRPLGALSWPPPIKSVARGPNGGEPAIHRKDYLTRPNKYFSLRYFCGKGNDSALPRRVMRRHHLLELLVFNNSGGDRA